LRHRLGLYVAIEIQGIVTLYKGSPGVNTS
jgi:DNA/RNA endonuclease YhcR with UshA esterase domain